MIKTMGKKNANTANFINKDRNERKLGKVIFEKLT